MVAEQRNVAERSVTITEAARLTGLSRKAIARRVERGALPSVTVEGRRRVDVRDLYRAGLLDAEPQAPTAVDVAVDAIEADLQALSSHVRALREELAAERRRLVSND